MQGFGVPDNDLGLLEGLIMATVFSHVCLCPHRWEGPDTPQEMGGGGSDFHSIYLFSISSFCVFLTAMDVLLGNPLPVVKGPKQLSLKYSWKFQREKVVNDAFYEIYQYMRKHTLERIEIFFSLYR